MTLKLISIFASICVGMAIFGTPTTASAQVVRPPRVHNHLRAQKDPAMVAAAKAAHQAHMIMKAALPIYEGHRALAMKLAAMADKDIREGFKGLPTATPVSFADRRPLKLNKNEERELAKYTPAQIQQSNLDLQKAVPLLQQAITDLGQAAGDYGGYRSQAVNSLNQSLQELNIALQLRSGVIK